MFLAEHPICADPFGVHKQRGDVEASSEVDHVIPLDAGGTDDEENLQALCKRCHSRKTAEEHPMMGRGA